MATQESLISLVNACDNFRPHLSSEPLVPFLLTPETRPAIGLLRPPVVAALIADNAWRSAHGHPLAWDIPASGTETGTIPQPYIAFAPALARGSSAARTITVAETVERWRADANAGGEREGTGRAFAGVMGGARWRGELYDVYVEPGSALRVGGDNPAAAAATVSESASSSLGSGYVFSIERAACKLFGLVAYGVHMTVYEGDANAVRVWVPRRAATKPTYPGMLDNSVAGGITGGMSAFASIVKEAGEEASLDPELVRKRARGVGALSYFYQTQAGWLQPKVDFVYDMRLEPGEAQLVPGDGEVESFVLMSVDEVVSRMRAGEFKPNCALVLLDFLVRHGYLTPENEPRYLEINQRLHGRFDLERW